jgi:hypothetical protein
MLEDDEMNSPSIERAAIPASADDGIIEPATDANKPTGPVNQVAWFDIEDGCYISEDPIPLEKNGLAPAAAQDNHPLPESCDNSSSPHTDGNSQCTSQEPGADGMPRPSNDNEHDASSQHSYGNAQCTSQEPGLDSLLQPRRKDSEHDHGESVSELEKDMLKAFKEQEDISLANTPQPLHSHRPSPDPECLQVDPEPDQSLPEVPRDASPSRTQLQLDIVEIV